MPILSYPLAGQTIHIHLKRSAKKNLILRPLSADAVSINIPPHLSERKLIAWLNTNEHLLQQTLARAANTPARDSKPKQIWYRGEPHQLAEHPHKHITLSQQTLWLPPQAWPQQKTHLQHFLRHQAAGQLLPALAEQSRRTGLTPAATALSNAKTFWGVCRKRTGIRLNWRLVGAPDFVVDYVCVHELCHLPHPNHSPAFWALVNHHTPHTAAAKQWLKQHGNELFALD